MPTITSNAAYNYLPYTYKDRKTLGLENSQRTLLLENNYFNVTKHEYQGMVIYQLTMWSDKNLYIESTTVCYTIEKVFATIIEWQRRKIYEEQNIVDHRYE